MKQLFKKDHLLNGLTIGLLVAALTFGLVLFVKGLLQSQPYWLSNPRNLFLISQIPNVLLFRYFMVNRKLDKIGRGILIVIIAVVLLALFFVK